MSDHDDKKPAEAQTHTNDEAFGIALPEDNIFDIPLNMDDEDPLAAVRDDPKYAELIKELEYIANQARLLFEPAEIDPSDKVWEGIQKGLETLPEEEV
jgi:hypothetical protein